jgi:hypothetical protein
VIASATIVAIATAQIAARQVRWVWGDHELSALGAKLDMSEASTLAPAEEIVTHASS